MSGHELSKLKTLTLARCDRIGEDTGAVDGSTGRSLSGQRGLEPELVIQSTETKGRYCCQIQPTGLVAIHCKHWHWPAIWRYG
jgi:hypothetical protein